ncbi:MAG: excinuclease ABC subunit UvrC [Bacteroidia bacterium]|nr:excinuclease ABC subunit UvrC [Bacteroidia bacterium]
MSTFNNEIDIQIQTLPEVPGIYKFYDTHHHLLYIGKAKNIKKRVSSYFQKEHDSLRLQLLVKKIKTIETITVPTEYDALILENALIKSLQPKYNIQLKDDKTYPWIVITKERFPKVFYTRKKNIPSFEYFGPYPSVTSVRLLIETIKEIFPLRTCNYLLSEENILKKKFRPCLDYHIGKCKAPCAALQTEEEYNQNIQQIKKIIKGQLKEVINYLESQKQEAVKNLEFEKAQQIKTKIELLQKYQAKSQVVSADIKDAEVYQVYKYNQKTYIGYFRIVNGFIIQTFISDLSGFTEEPDEEILSTIITKLREKFSDNAPEIILPLEPSFQLPDLKYTIPKMGDKKKILDLLLKNLEQYALEKEKQLAIKDPETHTNQLMQQMMKDLRMKKEPRRIEAFDNSNIQGTNAVSAMAVFIDGKPAKKEYRHFNVKTVENGKPDDFSTMKEVIYRRYKRVLEENLPLPDLIVIDGGKGQLHAALESLKKLGLQDKVHVISIAKRLEEIFFPNDSVPLYLDKRSPTLKVIQHIRDEVHRFGITHHRKRRTKSAFQSELLKLKGIGEKLATRLLTEFGSIEQIKNQSEHHLAKIVGAAKAKIIKEYFEKKDRFT